MRPSRNAARQFTALACQPPPRSTRFEPSDGPAGSEAAEFLAFDFFLITFGVREGPAGSDADEFL